MSSNEIIQLLGVIYFVFGLAFLLNKKYYKALLKEISKSAIFMLMGGYIALVIGFILIISFKDWSLSKDGLATLIGWIIFVKGLALIVYPKFYAQYTKNIAKTKHFNVIGFSVITLGLLFLYYGFIAL